MKIFAMAYSRSDAINRCASLGRRFLEHFHKAYTESPNSIDFSHHCQEMQSWYNDVSKMTLKQNNRRLTIDQLINWFFLIGSSTEELFDDMIEGDLYELFFIKLLSSHNSVEDVLINCLAT